MVEKSDAGHYNPVIWGSQSSKSFIRGESVFQILFQTPFQDLRWKRLIIQVFERL